MCCECVRCRTKEMRAVCVLVLVLLGAFIHCSYAIECYVCVSADGGYCDDFDKDHAGVIKWTCSGIFNACEKASVTAKCKNTFCTSEAILIGFFHVVACLSRLLVGFICDV